MNINFVDRFAEALQIRGLKQTDISSRSGIAPGTISNYAQGKYAPKDENLRKIAAALRVNPAWLMGFDVPMSSDDDLLQLLQDPSPAQLAWLNYQKAQAMSDQERLLILFNFGGDGSRVQIDFGSSNNDDRSQPFVNYSNPTLLWAGSICLYVPL